MNAGGKHIAIAIWLAIATTALAAEPARKSAQGEPFSGLVRRVPDGGIGQWLIGSRVIESDSFTLIDTFNATAAPGNCAYVLLRRSRALRIVLLDPLRC